MVMIICPDCGREQDNLNKFCRNCGADLSKVEVVEKTVDSPQGLVSENSSSQDLSIDNGSSQELSIENLDDSPQESNIGEKSEDLGDVLLEEKSEVTEDIVPIEKPQEENILKCSDCGTELAPNVKFCPNCGKSTMDLNKTSSVKFCPSCGAELAPNVKFCPKCGSSIGQAIQPKTTGTVAVGEKTPIVAVILSFIFPGLGQFYNGQGTKGLYFLIFAIISWILFIFYIGIVSYILVWLWSIYDAYKSSGAINRGEILEDKLF